MKHNNNIETLTGTSLLRIPISRSSMLMKVHSFLAFLLSMLFLNVLSAEAANHYVRSGATGSMNGSDWTNAYTSLPATLTRGDTYYIADGGYPGYVFDDAVSGTLVITIRKATITDHGTATGWTDNYGDGQAVFAPRLQFVRGYYVFDGVTGGGPGSWDSGHGFKILVADGNTVNDVLLLADLYGVAFPRQNTTNISISHVEMAADINTWSSAINSGSGFGLTVNNVILENMYVHGFAAIHIQTTGTLINNWLVQNSYFKGSRVDSSNHFASFRMDHANTVTIRNNILEDFSSTGCIGNYETATNISIYGNVFVHTPGKTIGAYNGVIYTNSSAIYATNYQIYNNSFVNLKNSSVIKLTAATTSGNVSYNNLIYNTTNDGVPVEPSIIGMNTRDFNWYYPPISHGEAHGQNGSGNPFVSLATGDYRLTTATAVGFTLPFPYNRDSFGNTRGADGTWDIGAYEYTGGTIPTYQCSDNIDNDNDGLKDYPADPGCSSLTDNDEYNAPVTPPISGNLILNGDFVSFTNTTANYWTAQGGGATYTLSPDTGRTGLAQKIAITAAGGWGMFYYQKPSLTLNKIYNWTFWYKTDGSNRLTAQVVNAQNSSVAFSENLPATNGVWLKFERIYNYTNSMADIVRIYPTEVGSYWIDDMSMVERVTAVDIAPPGNVRIPQ